MSLFLSALFLVVALGAVALVAYTRLGLMRAEPYYAKRIAEVMIGAGLGLAVTAAFGCVNGPREEDVFRAVRKAHPGATIYEREGVFFVVGLDRRMTVSVVHSLNPFTGTVSLRDDVPLTALPLEAP